MEAGRVHLFQLLTMERRLSPAAFVAAVAAALVAVLGASILLPHDRYYRYQAHSSGTTRKADWIYERLHFDPTPVDVALIGTSRMAGGLSAETIESDYCAATGRRIHVANLGIPETGRNMHYALAREAAKSKRPELFVVELNEVEARRPHPGFVILADAADVLQAPIALNLNYFADLARLPGRQTSLFLATVAGEPAVRRRFAPAAYAGRYFDRTRSIPLLDGRVVDKNVVRPRAELDDLWRERMSREAPLHMLPGPFGGLEYRLSRRYLDAIELAASKTGAETLYAYLPAYRFPAPPAALLRELAIESVAIDLGGASADNPALWFDATHWNAAGADVASRRFAAALARARPRLGRSGDCDHAAAPAAAP
jgi:hypothetical protein